MRASDPDESGRRKPDDYDVIHQRSGVILGTAYFPKAPMRAWGFHIWLTPFMARFNGMSDTKEEMMLEVRAAWDGWLAHMGLSERP